MGKNITGPPLVPGLIDFHFQNYENEILLLSGAGLLLLGDRHLNYSAANWKKKHCHPLFDLFRKVVQGQQLSGQFWTPWMVRWYFSSNLPLGRKLTQNSLTSNDLPKKVKWRSTMFSIAIEYFKSQLLYHVYCCSKSFTAPRKKYMTEWN